MNASTPEQDDDWLESALRASAAPELADEGFTLRVMQRLPDAKPQRTFERFTLIGAIVGTVIAYLGSGWPASDETVAAISAMVELHTVAVPVLLPWAASLCSAAVLAWVLNRA
jgi:hypothetical protein